METRELKIDDIRLGSLVSFYDNTYNVIKIDEFLNDKQEVDYYVSMKEITGRMKLPRVFVFSSLVDSVYNKKVAPWIGYNLEFKILSR